MRFVFTLLPFFCFCGKKKSETIVDGAPKVFFYASAFQQGSAIYGFNVATGEVALVLPHAQYTDTKLFFDAKAGITYAATRRATENAGSTLTRFSVGGSRIEGELGSLPVNLYGMGRALGTTDEFVIAGWNTGELAIIPATLSSSTIATVAPQGLTQVEDQRFLGSLISSDAQFVISGGTDANLSARPAKVHRISSDLQTAQSSEEIPDCKNIAGDGNDGFLAITSQKAIVTCNPRYKPDLWNGKMAVVLVDVSSGTRKFTSLLNADATADFDFYAARILSADASKVFIEEMAVTNSEPFSQSIRRYWLSLVTGVKTDAPNYGGAAFFDPISKSYIFSCARQAGGACKANTFCIVGSDGAIPGTTCTEKSVSFNYPFRSFAVTIPAL